MDGRAAATRRWPRTVLAAGLTADVVLTLAYVSAIVAGLAGTRAFKVLDLNMEANLPSWYEASKLLIIAVVLFALAVRPLASDPRLAPSRRLLAGLSLLFVYLSADEGGGIHERITGLLAGLPFVPSIGGNGVWIFLYTAAGLAGITVAVRQMRALAAEWPRELAWAAAGLAMMAAGGVLLEAVSYFWEPSTALYALEVAAEEFLEMAGASLVLYAVVRPFASAVAALVEPAVSDGLPDENPPTLRASGTG